ncbi:amidase domain-containing protein [Sarocladium implicatum]|nr:amidase domain-containing protein [Sarocladium implicatum]
MRIVIFLSFVAAAAAQLATTGATFLLDDVYYYVSPFPQGKAHDGALAASSKTPSAFGLTPVTVVSDSDMDKKGLESLFSKWSDADDVFQPGFLSTILLAGHKSRCLGSSFSPGVKSLIVPLADSDLPSGPYFLELATGRVYQAYRLYSDFGSAFTEPLLQTPDGSFQTLSAQIPGFNSPAVGVPSRLYFTRTTEKPLAGVRVGVKDIYSLAGQKKGCGNRAWWHLYPEANETAPAIQNLIDAGAVVVGYQKTSQFANGESPTADWVSQLAPFNPRGDGYNGPSSSSSGAGASIASYPWLDIAVGSDTGGSIRGPAGSQGLFGNRPSHGLVTLDLVMPLSPTLDTPGFLTRDPAIWDAASAAMYGANYRSLAGREPKWPKAIYTMGFPAADSKSPASRMLNDFAKSLATFTGGELETLNLTSAWVDSRSSSAPAVDLNTLLSPTYATLITKEQIELVREPFYADYAAAHNGRRPFVNPVPLSRWAWGDSVPDSWHADAVRNKTIFMDWFNDKILPRSKDKTQCTQGILLYPGSTGTPSPRNRYSASVPGAPLGFSTGRISVFAEVPDSVFPLGEVDAASTITGQNEPLPVTVDILVAKGCDGVIPRLAQDLVEAGIIPALPKTGGTLAGSEVLFRREVEEMNAWSMA